MTDPVKAPQKRKAPSYVTKTTFEKSVVSITKLVEQCRNDILTLREKLLTDKPVDGRALPEISPNDDSWLWAYETDAGYTDNPEVTKHAAENARIWGKTRERDNPERLRALVMSHVWTRVVVLAFIVDEELGTLGLHWPEGTMTSQGKPRMIRWASLAAMAQTYTLQNGFQHPTMIVRAVVRELLQARALLVRRGRIIVNDALRRILTQGESFLLPR